MAVLGPPAGCSNQAGQAAATEGQSEKILSLVAEFGEPGSALGKVKHSVERQGAVVVKEFEVEIEHGTPGDLYVVTLDGASIGAFVIDADGEGELEFSDDGSEMPFPPGFPEPEAGSLVNVGRFEATLRAPR